MKLRLEDDLLFASATLIYGGQRLISDRVVVDTGSTGTVFATEFVEAIGLQPEPTDAIRELRGVGGTEVVFLKTVDSLSLDADLEIRNFEIEIGAMDYGFSIDGILGLDFLLQVGAVIHLARLEISAVGRARKPRKS